MFVYIQFPMTDLRPFINIETNKLDKPSWEFLDNNIPNDSRPYLRYFGSLQKNVKGYNKFSTGEKFYCNSKNAIKIPDDASFIYINGIKYDIKLIHSQFFYDNNSLCKFELILKIRQANGIPSIYLKSNEVTKFINKILLKRFLVRTYKNSYQYVSLQYIGNYIKELYLASSTKYNEGYKNDLIERWWIKVNDPVVYIESSEYDILYPPGNSLKIELGYQPLYNNNNLMCNYLIIKNDNNFIKTWFVDKAINNDKDAIKNLKILILKMHQEQEILLSLIKVAKEKDYLKKYNIDKFNNSLLKVVTNFCKENRYGQSQQYILKEKLCYEKAMFGENFNDLLVELKESQNINDDIIRKILRLFDDIMHPDDNKDNTGNSVKSPNNSEDNVSKEMKNPKKFNPDIIIK